MKKSERISALEAEVASLKSRISELEARQALPVVPHVVPTPHPDTTPWDWQRNQPWGTQPGVPFWIAPQPFSWFEADNTTTTGG